ncbi:tRNA (N(6)-L-threonylcarbamoyladenosine(37)-C(2))-methylthiotransferase [Methanohalobium sp.]|uniref:tRNA (N(6)-L-threonylcarbamoyladenosine(37)-C(2))- methylthiotransferase n=1 Tax=Methanohalobium sp. TaxID=2837493 RepID=UPI0025E1489F|nr:tRNA (N(6)-L-threonylcarbamoyladenosine(37)-C(2))-methylthiotransferase [Methanohalobium sp.]
MKVHVATYGCPSSQAASEIMMDAIKRQGHELVNEKSAEVVVFNTCTVKYTTEQKILHKIGDLGKKGVDVVVSGCMPEVQLEDILDNNQNAHILGVNSITRINEVLDSIENTENKDNSGQRLEIFSSIPDDILNAPRNRFNQNIHICQISQGCNNRCAYCVVRTARGKLKSFDIDSIVEDVRKAVSEGCREIWITSQDNAQYGTDRQDDVLLPQLLDRVASINGNFKIRVGMMNPFSVYPILDDLLKVYENNKIYKFLHLPIQSASEKVLGYMNRNYTMSEVDEIITKFRSRFNDLTLVTDVIVGFPGETEDDFYKSVNWVKNYRPDKVNISRYTPRPHTKALEYRNIDSRIVVRRSNELHHVCDTVKLESKKEMVGWYGKVFVSKDAKYKGVMARTESYKPVVIPESNLPSGQWCDVEITDTTSGYFLGKLTD